MLYWRRALGIETCPGSNYASPTWADGKLYVPMFDGKVFVVTDEGESAKIREIDLGSACLAAPAVAMEEYLFSLRKNFIALGRLSAPPFVVKPSEELKHINNESSDDETYSASVPAEFALKAEIPKLFGFSLDKTERELLSNPKTLIQIT